MNQATKGFALITGASSGIGAIYPKRLSSLLSVSWLRRARVQVVLPGVIATDFWESTDTPSSKCPAMS
jgi:short-subunit dehydrogenase